MSKDIPFLHERIRVQDAITATTDDAFKSYANGRSIAVIFEEVNFNPGQCVFESDATELLTGNNLRFLAETITEYGSSLLFAPIGLEFLYSEATKP